MTAPTRRQFLAASAALPLAGGVEPRRSPTADAVIFIQMTGGPSQLDTFDPKPDAPAHIRGPFGTIPTRTPGVRVSELFPKLAAVSDRWSLIRSMTSDAPPIHEVGMQLVNTGRRFTGQRRRDRWPHMGSVLKRLGDTADDSRDWCHYGYHPDCGAGIAANQETWLDDGLGAGFLERAYSYTHPIRPCVLTRPGRDQDPPFQNHCLFAAGDVATGSRFVSLNMFETVFDAPSWDCHAAGGSLSCDLGDYRDTVAPLFDLAVSRLLTDLHDRGLLDRTLVVATGEFGRTPKPNCNGGRDHWTGCWTTLVAGGGVQGGRVVGRSDATASEPADRPVTPAELVATIFHAVGVPAGATIPGPAGKPVDVCNAKPVRELF